MLDFLLHQAPRSSKGLIFHNQAENRIWVDSFYMAPPFLAVAGHPDEAVKQVEGYRETLRSPEKGAYFHIWDEARQRFERKLLWGVGNGWAAAGMTRGRSTRRRGERGRRAARRSGPPRAASARRRPHAGHQPGWRSVRPWEGRVPNPGRPSSCRFFSRDAGFPPELRQPAVGPWNGERPRARNTSHPKGGACVLSIGSTARLHVARRLLARPVHGSGQL